MLDAAQSSSNAAGNNCSAGVEVGVGYQVGAQTGAYVYATANAGKGDYKNQATTNGNTHLSGGTVTLTSKGDATLKGADVKAGTIVADIGGKLAIESVQDTSVQHNQQSNVGVRVQASIGTAWQASGNASHSEANGSSAAVAEQSGLFAGEGGYHVKANSVALKGGAIASTSVANSELTTKAITFENLENKMDYKGQGASISGGFTIGSDAGATAETKKAQEGAHDPYATPGLPTQDKGSASSTTYATLTDGKLNIGGKAMDSAASLGAHTDAASATKAIAALPDLKTVMADQRAMAAASGTVIAASGQLAGDIAKAARKEGDKAVADIKKADADIADARAVLADTNSTAEQRALAEQGLTSATQARTDALQAANAAQKTEVEWSATGDKARALKAATDLLVGAVGGQSGGLVAANVGAPYLYKAIGDLAQEKTKPYTDAQRLKLATETALAELVRVDGQNADPVKRAQFQQDIALADAAMAQFKEQYNDWKDGSVNKIALHALATAALNASSGGSAVDGAIAGGLNEAKATLLDELTKGMSTSDRSLSRIWPVWELGRQ